MDSVITVCVFFVLELVFGFIGFFLGKLLWDKAQFSKIKIYLDDERSTPEGWNRFYTAEELIFFLDDDLRSHLDNIETISLDHDLGDGKKTGYNFLLWLEEKVHEDPTFPIPEIVIHSANPVGRANMARVLQSIERIRQAHSQE